MLTHELLTSDQLPEILAALYEVRDYRDGKNNQLSEAALNAKATFEDTGAKIDAGILVLEKTIEWRKRQ